MENKKCTGCGLIKGIEEFSWKNKKLNKKRSKCKVCISEIDKENYKTNTNRQKKIRNRANEQIKFNKEFIKKYKKFLKCS
jgi:phenylpyruvate tautomerase PptA (4-oxalocrotonate tautomerase family)